LGWEIIKHSRLILRCCNKEGIKMLDTTEKQVETLKKLRAKLGLNRTEFSKLVGIPLRTLEEWEAGNRKMPEYVLRFLVYYVLGRNVLFKDKDAEYIDMTEIEDLYR
ncbi:helix-turn-helix domain-containing protein, partial [Pseudobutyrivibrio sp.]